MELDLMRDTHALRRVAVAAKVDPRTVLRLLRGKPVRYAHQVRIEAALRRLKLTASAA